MDACLYGRNMKSNIMFFIGMVFSILNFCMEESLAPCTKTEINIRKGSIYDADGKVDILVVGLREQKRLDRTFHIVDKKGYEIDTIGAVQFMRRSLSDVSIMKKEDDSNSTEETDHHPCEIIKHRDHNFYEKKMNSRVLVVVEPKMSNVWYGNQRENYEYIKKDDVLYGEDAIQAAKIDLFKCYNSILKAGLQKLGDKKDKSIAIHTLSTSVGFPRKDAAIVALMTIIVFIKNNPEAYSRIELFVKKRFEFTEYCQSFLNNRLSAECKSEQDESIKEFNK